MNCYPPKPSLHFNSQTLINNYNNNNVFSLASQNPQFSQHRMAFSSQFSTPNKHQNDDEQQQSHHHQREARYVPLDIVYSATSPCTGYSNVMSKKVKATKFDDLFVDLNSPLPKPPVIHFYTRKRYSGCCGYDAFLDNLKAVEVKVEDVEFGDDVRVLLNESSKKRKTSQEVVKLGHGLGSGGDTPRLRGSYQEGKSNGNRRKNKAKSNVAQGDEVEVIEVDNISKSTTVASRTKRWVRYVRIKQKLICFVLFVV